MMSQENGTYYSQPPYGAPGPGSGTPYTPPQGAPYGAPYAPPCPPPATKNKFLTFVFSLFPGAGQMYHGLYKKGVSLMFLFFACYWLSGMTELDLFRVFLPVIWFYSFFEALNRINMPLTELQALKDHWLFNISKESEQRAMSPKCRKWIGWGLIVLAFLTVWNKIINSYSIMNLFPETVSWWIERIGHYLPAAIMVILCLGLGIWMIRKKDTQEPLSDEEK